MRVFQIPDTLTGVNILLEQLLNLVDALSLEDQRAALELGSLAFGGVLVEDGAYWRLVCLHHIMHVYELRVYTEIG